MTQQTCKAKANNKSTVYSTKQNTARVDHVTWFIYFSRSKFPTQHDRLSQQQLGFFFNYAKAKPKLIALLLPSATGGLML